MDPIESLVGTYDIFYFNVDGCGLWGRVRTFHQRIPGSIFLSLAPFKDGPLFRGEVKMHPELNKLCPFDFMKDFTFVSIDEEKETEFMKDFRTTNMIPQQDFLEFGIFDFPCWEAREANEDEEECTGTIQIVSERTATPWSACDNQEDDDDGDQIAL